MSDIDPLLPHGADLALSDLDSAARYRDRGRGGSCRSLTATVVAIGPDDRLAAAADALQRLEPRIAVRTILIAGTHSGTPAARAAGDAIAISGLEPRFVDNAVAALRLSSLPTLVWFRGGAPDMLDQLASLAERVVLDEDRPMEGWRRAAGLIEHTAFSDLRWGRLTRWRALMAHFFDIPAVRDASRDFTTLRIGGNDRIAAQLYAAWLQAMLSVRLDVQIHERTGGTAIEEIVLGDHDQTLTLRLLPNRTCVQSTAAVRGHQGAARTVALGDQSLTALISEELRVRARDTAFERAMRACVAVA